MSISEWATKEELIRDAKLNPETAEKDLSELINKGEVEADYTNPTNPRFRIGKNLDINKFVNSLKGKYGEPKNITISNDKFESGYIYLKHKFEEIRTYPKDIIEQVKISAGIDLEKPISKDIFNDAELFEIEPKTKWALLMTDNEISERELPYKKIVIDCDLNIDNIWFKGILLTSGGTAWTYRGNNDYDCKYALIFKPFIKEDTLGKNFLEPDMNKATLLKLKTFICNFIDFLNNPEVRIIRIARGQKNIERRIKSGKEVLPPTNKVMVTGVLKQYFDEIENQKDKVTYNHRFWVRGHFKRFWNKEKYNRLYSLLKDNKLPSNYHVDEKIRKNDKIIMIWNKPFIKGTGVLISRKYEVKRENGKSN